MSDFEESMIQRIKRLEREVERLQKWERPVVITDHGALTGLADNDHPQYLLTTGKAADSDKLDGVDSTGFSLTSHNHTGVYLPIAGKAADSDKLDGVDSTGFSLTSHNHTGVYLPIAGKAADSDKLDGNDSSYFAVAPSSITAYTATLVGWSGTPTQAMKYVMIGKLMILTIYITGSSNATVATATLPSGITAMALGNDQRGAIRITNAGALGGSWGMVFVASGGSTLDFRINQKGDYWTNSGTKTVEGTFIFLTA